MGNKPREQREWLLPLLCLAAALYGLLLVYSATRYDPDLRDLPKKQAAALGLGLFLCLMLSRLRIRLLLERIWWLLPVWNVGLLLLLLPLGKGDSTGNRSWISLPGGLFNLQPAELVKITFLLLLAFQLDHFRDRGLDRPVSILLLSGHALTLCAILYLVSGDIGMMTVFLGIYGGMLWSAGIHPLWLLSQAAAAVGAAVLLWPHLPDYVRMRFLVVLDHDLDPLGKGFQQARSLLAIGSGQLRGQGYLRGIQTQSASPSSLPARHTDLIFSAAGEELGLVGCGLILLLLAAILLRCVVLSRRAGDPLLRDVAMGVVWMLGIQTVLNVGMCLYVLPVVGVTLPFFSYGGSSLVASFAGLGLLLSPSESRSPARNRQRLRHIKQAPWWEA